MGIGEKMKRLEEAAKEMASAIISAESIRVVSHYDADGISSAAIMTKALVRANRKFHLSIVKQLDEGVLQAVADSVDEMVLFLDLGSGYLGLIKNHLSGKRIAVADHHQISGIDESILHLNPLKWDINEDISGAGITYLIAKAMDEENIDLSHIAIIGAIGDAQVGSIGREWGLLGINKEILKDAQAAKKIAVTKGLRIFGRYNRPIHKALEYSVEPYIPGISGSESASVAFLHEIGIELKEGSRWRTLADLTPEEQKRLADHIILERIAGNMPDPDYIFGDIYELLDREEYRDANEFATVLNATGKLGHAHLGVSICLDGNLPAVKELVSKYRSDISKGLRHIESHPEIIAESEECVFILAGSRISEHLISNVASILNRSVYGSKPLFAFAAAGEGKTKVSARISEALEGQINLKEIMEKICSEVGGQGGGHHAAAGGTISSEAEETFIKLVRDILKGLRAKQEKEAVPVLSSQKEEEREDDRKDAKKIKLEGKGLVRYLSP